MLLGRSALLALTIASCFATATAQTRDDAQILIALDRWAREFLAGKVDVTDPRPIQRDAPARLPPSLSAHTDQRLTELQALELLLRSASEQGTTAAAERLLRLAAIGLEPQSAKLTGAAIVRGAAEEALDDCAAPAMHAYLIDAAQGATKSSEQPALRLAAVRALGGSGQAVFWPMLAGLLRDSDGRLRAATARALGDLGNARSIADVAQALREETDPSVMQAITLALRDLLDVAERNGELDPLLHLDAIAAVAQALRRADRAEWRTIADMVRFLEQHRATLAVPVLIEVLAAAQPAKKERPDEPPGARILQTEAHRALKALTGAVLGADQVDRWRTLWESAKDTLEVVPRRRQAPSDKATSAGFFGIPVLGRRVVFVIDRSGSMVAPAPQPDQTSAGSVSSRLDIACLECWKAVRDMGPDTYFNLVAFSSQASAWKPDLVPATPANKGALRKALERLAADGSTNLWDGLSLAMNMQTTVSSTRQREAVDEIFVLSDGHPSSGEITHARTLAARIAEQNRHTGIRINTVFIGSLANELDTIAARAGGDAAMSGSALMRELAAQNQGTYVAR